MSDSTRPSDGVENLQTTVLPCPFCNGQARLRIASFKSIYIYCHDCGARGPERFDPLEARRLWNMRPATGYLGHTHIEVCEAHKDRVLAGNLRTRGCPACALDRLDLQAVRERAVREELAKVAEILGPAQ